jgi:hypothetical protein
MRFSVLAESIKFSEVQIMWNKIPESIREAIKTGLRNLVLGIIPALAAYLKTLPVEWAGVVYLLLVALDNFLHEYWKAQGDSKKGLVPF